MSRGNVLVVDDEPAILASVAELFGQEYQLFLATDAREALAILDRERVHVVLSDYKMPGMDGIALLIEVKNRHPGVVRVLMTGYADMQLVIRAMNEGEIQRFLSKPFRAFELRRIIEEAVGLSRIVERRPDAPQGRTVLVAHDSTIAQTTLRMALTPGYAVLATGNGIEALNLLSTRTIDAIVIGVGLELIDGVTIVSWLKREKRSTIPVVIWGTGIYGPYEEYLRDSGADIVIDDSDAEAPARLQQFLKKRLA
jgi:DNA-binding NtrC family response regulator